MSFDYDAVVVGARVAGASTATLLARYGRKVLLVDRATMPSDTVSTHAILRSGVLQLQRWGILDSVIDSGAPPIRNVTLGFGDERIHIEVRPDYGVAALVAPRRYVLDNLLVEAAVESGAEFRGGTRVTDVLRGTAGDVAGVTLGRSDEHVSARIVIGADGYNSRIARLVGSGEYRSHEAMNAVHYAYFSGIDHSGFWFQFTPGVNAGLIATNNDQVLVFAGRPARRADDFRDDPETEFRRLLRQGGNDLADLVEEGTRETDFRGTRGLRGFMRQPWGEGWALVGDAGHTKDPISAHGISDCLRDAELLARAVHEGFEDPHEMAPALGEYQYTRDRLSHAMYEASLGLARYDWEPSRASELMRVISASVHHECEHLLTLPSPAVMTAA